MASPLELSAMGDSRPLTRRQLLHRLGLLGLVAPAGVALVGGCDKDPSAAQWTTPRWTDPEQSVQAAFAIDASTFPWPAGLIAMWDFQEDSEGGNTVSSHVGTAEFTLTARGNRTVVKDTADRGPFGPSLVLDGKTVFAKDGDIGALDVTTTGTQVSVVNWVNDTANDHDDNGGFGLSFRAGSHCEGGEESARQYGSYFDAVRYISSHGHYTPHIGAQDGASPGFAYNHDYAASARKYFSGVGQGQWHMEAFTYDGEKIIAYVDGLADEWKAVAEPPPFEPGFTEHPTVDRNPYFLGKPINSSPTKKRFSIGAAINGKPPFEGVNYTIGKLGGVAVFNRALSAAEIMAIRIGTLPQDAPITTYSFEVSSLGAHPLGEIGWTAKSGAENADVSSDGGGEGYRVSRPAGSSKAFLRKTSPAIGAAWVPLSGLTSSQIKRVRFKLLSAVSASAPQRVLVRVGSRWWASDSAYKTRKPHPDQTFWARADVVTHALSWGSGQWRPVTIEPGVLSVSDATNTEAIGVDSLTALGFVSQGGNGSVVRISDVELLQI